MNGILILVVYAAIMIGTTILFARNGTGKDDFYVGISHSNRCRL